MIIFYIKTYPKFFCQRVQFFTSNWLENSDMFVFWVLLQATKTRCRRLTNQNKQIFCQIFKSIWKEELHPLAKEFWVSYYIKTDHKEPTNNRYFMKKKCRRSPCYHNRPWYKVLLNMSIFKGVLIKIVVLAFFAFTFVYCNETFNSINYRYYYLLS